MAKTYKCAYKMCDNLGIAVDPVKYNNKYYCKTCLEEMQRNTDLRKKIMDTTLEIIPKEIPSLINKVINQWIELDYSLEYILYTVKYIKLNKCILNHFYGVRYYMNKDEIKKLIKIGAPPPRGTKEVAVALPVFFCFKRGSSSQLFFLKIRIIKGVLKYERRKLKEMIINN